MAMNEVYAGLIVKTIRPIRRLGQEIPEGTLCRVTGISFGEIRVKSVIGSFVVNVTDIDEK